MTLPKKRKPHYLRRCVLTSWVFITLGPFLPLVIISFAWRWNWPDILPSQWWSMQPKNDITPLGWDYVFSRSSRLGEATLNSLIIGLGVVVLGLAICIPAARFFAKNSSKSQSVLEVFLATPLLIPEIAMASGLVMAFSYFRLDGHIVAVIFAHLVPTIPYMLRILSTVYQALPDGYSEQAQILGASPFQRFYNVTLPMLMPAIAAGSLFSFLVSSNIFLLTFMIGNGKIITLPTLLFSTLGGGAITSVAAALTLIVSLPGIILLVLLDKYIYDDTIGVNIKNG